MGNFCKPSYNNLTDSSEVVAGTEIPAWVAEAGRNTFARAADIGSEDYPVFPGKNNRIADLTADERAGMSILRNGAENYLPFMNKASGIANRLGRGYNGMSERELLGNPYRGASRRDLEGNFKGLSSGQLMGKYRGASRKDLLGSYNGASRENLLGSYNGMSREDLLGSYDGMSREDLLGSYDGMSREDLIGQGVDPFSMDNAQQYMDIYQSSMDPAVREIEQQTMQAQNQARASAARSGAFGGSRLGIMEGTAAGEGAQAVGDLRAQAAREGLGFAAGRYDEDVAQSERDRAARFSAEDTMRSRFMDDREARFGAEDTMRGQFLEDREARFGAEDTMRGQFLEDRQGRFSAEDTMRNRFMDEREARFGAEDTMRGQFLEDRQGRFTAEDARRAQAENDRSARFSAEDVMYGRYGDQRAARFDANTAGRDTYETNEAARYQQMKAYENMGALTSDLQNTAAAGLIGSGESQRAIEQAGYDLAYADYLDQRDYDKEQVNFVLGALSGTPYNTVSRTYDTKNRMSETPSIFGQTLAGMGGLASAYNMTR